MPVLKQAPKEQIPIEDFLVMRYHFDKKHFKNVQKLHKEAKQKMIDYGIVTQSLEKRLNKLNSELYAVQAEAEMIKYILQHYFPEKDLDVEVRSDVTKEQFSSFKNACETLSKGMRVKDVPLCTLSDVMYITEHFSELEEVYG